MNFIVPYTSIGLIVIISTLGCIKDNFSEDMKGGVDGIIIENLTTPELK